MLTYSDARDILTGTARSRNTGQAKIAGNTVLRHVDPDTIAVRFHSTDIILIHSDGSYTLNTGGHHTYTTKSRLNEYGPVSVYQQQYVWYVVAHTFHDGSPHATSTAPVPFEDGMRVLANGTILTRQSALSALGLSRDCPAPIARDYALDHDRPDLAAVFA